MSFAGESPSEIFLICTFQLFVVQGGTNRTPSLAARVGDKNARNAEDWSNLRAGVGSISKGGRSPTHTRTSPLATQSDENEHPV